MKKQSQEEYCRDCAHLGGCNVFLKDDEEECGDKVVTEEREYAVTVEHTMHARVFLQATSVDDAIKKAGTMTIDLEFDEAYATLRIVEIETPDGEILETNEVISEP